MTVLFLPLAPVFVTLLTSAQQFVDHPGALPGPVVWSESVVPLDVNNDGRLDLFFINAQGYEVPGDYGAPSANPLRPTLLINTGNNGSVPVFQDRTDALIPASIVVHGKSTAVCDVDGDGLEDLVIATAFGDQQRLLRKDPVGPGYLDETFRLPTLILNSFHVGWGDLDDDGDIDLVFTDAGPNSFSAPGGKARLLLNDGTGFFTDSPGKLHAIHKIGSQNAKIVDIDGDLDLDVIIDGKSSLTQVYLNDGNANFSVDTALIPAAASANNGGAYETEWGDLDDDQDIDCIYMNFAGGSFPTTDIVMRNEFAETGSLNFTAYPGAFSGQNAQDENDFALLDADDDGDLDLLVATLTFGAPVTSEKLFLNSGTIGTGFLAQVSGAFTNIHDSTLDLAVADLNQDGRYDIVTANGEIPTTPFTNRYYENTGPKDNSPPSVGRVTAFPTTMSADDLQQAQVVRSWIQDSVVDDGGSFVRATLKWEVSKNGVSVSSSVPMPHIGGQVFRGEMMPAPISEGLVGASVSYTVAAVDPRQNSSSSVPAVFTVCGSESYGIGTGLCLSGPVTPSLSGSSNLRVAGGEPNRQGILWLGQAAASIALPGGTLLVDPQGALRYPFLLNASGAAEIALPWPPNALPGLGVFAQVFARSSSGAAGMVLSNGVEVVLCE